MNKCNMCPRMCNVNRLKLSGFCGQKNLKISKVMLHKWEEPIISGCEEGRGSGAIFFSGCNLRCEYCQNYQISHLGQGEEVSVQTLATLFKQLEESGAYNINLVTPTHFTDSIIEALKIYRPQIPIVWNTSGYETIENIEKLKGYIDVFLTDLKYATKECGQYSQAPNYFERASQAILKMREIIPNDIVESGIMIKGLIIRHLVLPNNSNDSIKVLEWINKELGNETYLSIMSQYIPCFKAVNNPALNRPIKKIEYDRVVKKAISLNFKNVFIQEFSSADSSYIPDFNNRSGFDF